MKEDREYQPDEHTQQEGLRQDAVIHGGLAGIGIVMVQPFLTTSEPLDTSGTICVIAFAVAIPLLAAMLMVNHQESFRRRRSPSIIATGTSSIAQAAAFTGLVAGFWHIHWVAGVAFLSAGLVGLGAHSAGYSRLEFLTLTKSDPPEAPTA